MGRRARQDPQHHANRSSPPERGAVAPPALLVAFPLGFEATRGTHPEVADDLLDLNFIAPYLRVVLRLPVAAWDDIEDAVHKAITDIKQANAETDSDELARRAAAAGVHLPVGVDLDEEADAHRKIREGDHA